MGSNFLQQFMAGWQMGQGRNENARRDQELQMEQARQKQEEERRAAMFQLQQEEFKLRKKQLAAEEHASRLEAAKEAFRMRTEAASMQGLPAPTAADVGIPEQGPEMAGPPAAQVSVPQPTMALPNPLEGQPDISMPVLTGAQQRMMAQAAQQRKLQEALGLKRGQEAIEAEFRAPERPISVAPGATLFDPKSGKPIYTAPKPPPEPGDMSPKKASNFRAVTTKFQSDKAIENANNSAVAIELADQVIADPGNAANQLMTVYSLIKNLDQGSAVREGETALVQSTLSYVQQYENAVARLTRNQLIPPETAKEFASATKRLAEQWVKVGKKKVQQYKAQAGGLGIGNEFKTYLQESGIEGLEVTPGGGTGKKRVINGVTVEEVAP